MKYLALLMVVVSVGMVGCNFATQTDLNSAMSEQRVVYESSQRRQAENEKQQNRYMYICTANMANAEDAFNTCRSVVTTYNLGKDDIGRVWPCVYANLYVNICLKTENHQLQLPTINFDAAARQAYHEFLKRSNQ